MNRIWMILTGAAMLLFLQMPAAAEVQTVKKARLDNGLVILTKPLTTNDIVSVVVSLRMGSLYESDGKAGLYTLLQNTVTRGTKTRTSEMIAEELERMGTRISVSADREYGTITIQSTAESLYRSMDVLGDIIRNATFPEDAVALQKTLQIRGIMARRDQPLYRAIELMAEEEYGAHPFHKPAMGYPETVDALTREDIVNAYASAYVANNMVITAVGNFEEKRFVGTVTRMLGDLPAGASLPPVRGAIADHGSPSSRTEARDTAASWFALGWIAPALDDSDFHAMEVLDAVTGGSMNSRLFVAIREQRGLAYQVSSSLNARKESGIYFAYIGTKPETCDEARAVLLDEIFRMKREKVSDEELTLAKSYLRGMYIMSLESNSGQAARYGQYETLGLGWDFGDRYLPGIERVTADDIIRVAGKYLTSGYSLGGVLATPGDDPK